MRATFDNVTVLVEGLPEGSQVSLGIDEEGLIIGGYGMLAWEDTSVVMEDLTPKGLRLTIGMDGFPPSVFFIPVGSMGDNRSVPALMADIRDSAVNAGAVIEPALNAA